MLLTVRRFGRGGGVLPFEDERRLITQRRVPTARVVPPLDESEDGKLRLARRREALAVKQLAFERRKEALAQRIVVTIATEPIEVRTPAARQRAPKATAVY